MYPFVCFVYCCENISVFCSIHYYCDVHSVLKALNYGKYTTQSDVWSYGILLWEMFSCGSVPYPGLSNNEARDRVEEGYRMECPRGCPDEVYQIMKECWEYEPEDRPAFQAVGDRLKKIHKKTK